MKRFLLSLVALGALLGIAHAVNITGSDNTNANRIASMGYARLSVTNAITAAAGGGQTNAVLLTSAYNRVTVVATAADSVKLPPCVAGAGAGLANTVGVFVWVTNNTAATNLAVFPNTGDLINQGAANASFTVAGAKSAVFVCGVAGSWNALLSG